MSIAGDCVVWDDVGNVSTLSTVNVGYNPTQYTLLDNDCLIVSLATSGEYPFLNAPYLVFLYPYVFKKTTRRDMTCIVLKVTPLTEVNYILFINYSIIFTECYQLRVTLSPSVRITYCDISFLSICQLSHKPYLTGCTYITSESIRQSSAVYPPWQFL